LAHVDHGKTTIADRLISTNGVISARLAGKVRWMDSTVAEQEKGITMKASSISLLYNHDHSNGTVPRRDGLKEDYLINLIDSPGHVDFSGEVSTAVRLCDGAIVVVDVVEGVCIQTQAVLRQAWSEKVQPCLVLNKIDRLYNELHLSELEVYHKLTEVLEQVNAVTGALWGQLMQEKFEKSELELLKSSESGNYSTTTTPNLDAVPWTMDSEDDSKLYFAPERGNVVFASAVDGWGFRIHQFAKIHAEQNGMKRSMLQKVLWGDHYINMKKKRVYTSPPSANSQPMFVQWVLKNIWDIYNLASEKNQAKTNKVVKMLKLAPIIPTRELDVSKQSKSDIIHAIMSRWLPLSESLFSMVVEHCPSPRRAQKLRMNTILNLDIGDNWLPDDISKNKYHHLVKSVESCDIGDEAPVVCCISKVLVLDKHHSILRDFIVPAVGSSRLTQNLNKNDDDETKNLNKNDEKKFK